MRWNEESCRSCITNNSWSILSEAHYQSWLPQSSRLLLKNHSLFLQNRYAHQQAAILRGTFHRFFRGRDSMKWNEESCRSHFGDVFGCPSSLATLS